jgi:hypothetical protein
LCPYCNKKLKAEKEIQNLILKEIEKLPQQIKTKIKILLNVLIS